MIMVVKTVDAAAGWYFSNTVYMSSSQLQYVSLCILCSAKYQLDAHHILGFTKCYTMQKEVSQHCLHDVCWPLAK
jgi:hypothetical protein